MKVAGLAVLVATLLSAGVAGATDFTFKFSAPTSDFGTSSAGGSLEATSQGDGSYLITEISGEWNGETITGGPSGYLGADNLIYPDQAVLLDNGGFSFTVDGRGSDFSGDVNIYYETDGPGYTDSDDATGLNGTFSLSKISEVSGAPEPSVWALTLGGIGMFGGLLRVTNARRREDETPGMASA